MFNVEHTERSLRILFFCSVKVQLEGDYVQRFLISSICRLLLWGSPAGMVVVLCISLPLLFITLNINIPPPLVHPLSFDLCSNVHNTTRIGTRFNLSVAPSFINYLYWLKTHVTRRQNKYNWYIPLQWVSRTDSKWMWSEIYCLWDVNIKVTLIRTTKINYFVRFAINARDVINWIDRQRKRERGADNK